MGDARLTLQKEMKEHVSLYYYDTERASV